MSAELKMAVAEGPSELSDDFPTQEPFQMPCFGSGSGSSSDIWHAPPAHEDLPQFGRGSSSEMFEDDAKADSSPVVDLKAAAARAKRQEEALAALGNVSQMLKSPVEEDMPPATGLKDLVLVAGLPRDTDGTESEDSLAISSETGTVGTDHQDADMCRSSPEAACRPPLEPSSGTGTVIYSPRTTTTGGAADGVIVAALRERCVHLENEGFALREEVLKLREQLKTSEQEQLKASEQLAEQARREAASPEEAQKQPQVLPQSPCRMGRAQSPSGCRGRHPSQPSQSPPPLLPRVDMSEIALQKAEQPPFAQSWIDSPAPPNTPPSPAASMKLQNFFFEPDSGVRVDSPETATAQSPITSGSASPCATPRSGRHTTSMKVLVCKGSAEAVFKFEPCERMEVEAGEMPSESQLLQVTPNSGGVEACTPKTEIVESDSDDDPDVALLGPRLPAPMEKAAEPPAVAMPTHAPDAPQSALLTCPNGHLMNFEPPAEDGVNALRWVCDGCEKRSCSARDSPRFRCNHCDFDLCGRCSSDGPDVQHSPAFICPQGHKLQVYSAVGPFQWACQGCSKSEGWTSETLRYKCPVCSYNVCDACRSQQRSGHAALPGAASMLSHRGPCRNSSACMPFASQQQTVRQSVSAASFMQFPAAVAKASSLTLPPGGTSKPKGIAMLPFGKSSTAESRSSTPAKGAGPPPVALATALPIPARMSAGSKTLNSESSSEADSLGNSTGPLLYRMKTSESLGSESTCASPVPRTSRSTSPGRIRLLSASSLSGSGQQKVMVSVAAPTAPPATARIMVEPNPNEPPISMPATFETFEWLGNLALPIIAKGVAAAAELGRAFRFSDEANSVHIHLHGTPSGEATYNKACCFSIAAAAFFEASDSVTEDVAPGLPPTWSGAQPLGIAEARLELAITMLDQAVAAGFSDTAQMTVDPDLRTVRERRPVPFAAVIQRAYTRKQSAQPATVISQPVLCPPAGGASPASSNTAVPYGGIALPSSAESNPLGPKVSPCTPGSVARQSLGSCTAVSPTPVRNLASLAKELPTSIQPGECL